MRINEETDESIIAKWLTSCTKHFGSDFPEMYPSY